MITVKTGSIYCMLMAFLTVIPLRLHAADFQVNSPIDTNDYNVGDGLCSDAMQQCSLRAAIEESNALAGADNIFLESDHYILSLAGRLENYALTGDLDITDEVKIVGKGALNSLIDADTIDRIFDIRNSVAVTIKGVSLVGGDAYNNHGGAIRQNYGQLFINNSRLDGNQASNGGAIKSASGTVLRIVNSVLIDNAGSSGGGGIHFQGDYMYLGGSDFISNYSQYSGGAVTSGGTSYIGDCYFYGNVANRYGGALLNTDETNLIDSRFEANLVILPYYGGAIYNNSSSDTLSIKDTEIIDNFSAGSGGGISNYSGIVDIVRSSISNNEAIVNGGGIRNSDSLYLTNSTISGNIAGDAGGGIYSHVGNADLRSSTIAYNQGDKGGGVYTNSFNTMTLMHTIIAQNIAVSSGNDCDESSSTTSPFVSEGFNLIGDLSGCNYSPTVNDRWGDSSSGFNLDPMLRPLAYNGGSTQSHALVASSPAIDAGSLLGCADDAGNLLSSDQRKGHSRTLDGNSDTIAVCDIGAFEY